MSSETHDARDFVAKYSCKNHSSCDYAHCCDYADLTDGNFQDKVKKKVHSGCNGCLSPWRRWEVPPLEVPSQRQDCHESHGPATLDSFDSFDSDWMSLLLILHIFRVHSLFTPCIRWLSDGDWIWIFDPFWPPGSSLFLVFCTLTIFAKLGAMCFTVTCLGGCHHHQYSNV